MKPLNISNLVIDTPIILAPMAGYTDLAFRATCKQFGCGLVFTEVVNAEGLARRMARTMHLLETAEDERPIAAHIYGRNPESMAKAAIVIESLGKFDLIDINCGCPVRKIVAKGSGAALIKEPEQIGKIVKAIKAEVSMPVTVKTRIGFDEDNVTIFEIADAVQEAGGDAISIHARLAKNKHSGDADWKILREVKSKASIPVIGNGGINSAEDVPKMLEQTGVDGVMIGRAAVGNPWLFDEINHLMAGKEYKQHDSEEHRKIVMGHLERLVKLVEVQYKYRKKVKQPAEGAAVCHFRAHFFKYFSGYKGFGKIKRELNDYNSVKQIVNAIDQLL